MVEYTFQPKPVIRVTGFSIMALSAWAQMSVRPEDASLMPMEPIPNTRSAMDAAALGSAIPITTAPMTARIIPAKHHAAIRPGGMTFLNIITAMGYPTATPTKAPRDTVRMNTAAVAALHPNQNSRQIPRVDMVMVITPGSMRASSAPVSFA